MGTMVKVTCTSKYHVRKEKSCFLFCFLTQSFTQFYLTKILFSLHNTVFNKIQTSGQKNLSKNKNDKYFPDNSSFYSTICSLRDWSSHSRHNPPPPPTTHTHTKPLPVPAAAFGSSTVSECWWLRASVWIHSRAQHDLLTSQSLDERWTVDDCFPRCPRLDWKMGHTGYKGQSHFESRRCTSGGVVFTSTKGESYCRQLRSLLLHLYIFWALITSLRCWCLLWRQLIFLTFCFNNQSSVHCSGPKTFFPDPMYLKWPDSLIMARLGLGCHTTHPTPATTRLH